MWHDCSTLSNHSHFLMMVSTMYDTAVHLTSNEYFKLRGENIDVQSIVEEPYLYIFGRCPSNDQQLLYSEERIEDIMNINKKVVSQNEITDVA